MTIHNLAEKEIRLLFKDFTFPTQDGVFCGTLITAQWAKHSVIHTFWRLDNGSLLDCPVFKENRPVGIELLSDNAYAELTFIRLDSNKVYLRAIREIRRNEL